MAFATGLEGLVMMMGRFFRRDYQEGDLISNPRWFQWGYVSREGGSRPARWYILVMLPSYVMKQAFLRWDGPPTWHQCALMFTGVLPAGAEGWRMIEVELP